MALIDSRARDDLTSLGGRWQCRAKTPQACRKCGFRKLWWVSAARVSIPEQISPLFGVRPLRQTVSDGRIDRDGRFRR